VRRGGVDCVNVGEALRAVGVALWAVGVVSLDSWDSGL
jgi:hypothetical protein